MNTTIKYGTIFIFFSLTLIMIVLLPYCIKNIQQNEYAVTENQLSMKIHGPFEQGALLIKPLDKLTIFERTYRHYERDITCMTYDKTELTHTITLQWEYIKEYIIPIIYYKFSTAENHYESFDSKIVGSIITSCAKFTAIDYYDKRSQAEEQMIIDLNQTFSGIDMGVRIMYLQLKNVAFPSKLSQVIVNRQLLDQERITQINNRTSEQINAETKLLSANRTAIIIDTNANYTANLIITRANITKQIMESKWNYMIDELNNVKIINEWNNTQLLYYMKYKLLATASETVINFKNI